MPSTDEATQSTTDARQSSIRAFFVLVAHSFQRHWRVRQMGWVSVGLLTLVVAWVFIVTVRPAGWGLPDRPLRRAMTNRQAADHLDQVRALPLSLGGQGVAFAVVAPVQALVRPIDDPDAPGRVKFPF